MRLCRRYPKDRNQEKRKEREAKLINVVLQTVMPSYSYPKSAWDSTVHDRRVSSKNAVEAGTESTRPVGADIALIFIYLF